MQRHVERVGDHGQPSQLGQLFGEDDGGGARVDKHSLSVRQQTDRCAREVTLEFDVDVRPLGDGRFVLNADGAAVYPLQLPLFFQSDQVAPHRLA
ncbi:hypothetical protein D3C86_1369540 [compost metagenome]